jgi:8-oxo-dGTP pyrophosphatase MutT (NUDIX family)
VPPDTRFDEALRERVRGNLAAFDRQSECDPALAPAAVAVVLVDDEAGAPCFLITRRASGLRSHGGQWALPGGRLDTGETPVDAALRELREELGLALAPEHVLGLLDDYPTRSGYRITPVVAWGGRGAALEPDPREVAGAWRVPLAELVRPEVPLLRRIPESDRPLISIPLATVRTDVHAPTAAILYQVREVALFGRATRVAHYEQPVFAWR